MNQENKQILPAQPLTKKQFSNVQPVWQFVLLSIVTFGIYGIYWFYKTWKDINNYTGTNFRPGWRTFGLFIPFYNLIRIDGMFRHDIELLRASVGGEKFIKRPFLYGFVYVFLAAINPFWWLSFLSVLPLAVVQSYLNYYWKKGQPELPEKKKFSNGQI